MGEENMRLLERLLMLQTIDRLWVEHLTAMDEMRQGIGLQAYGQQDPLVAVQARGARHVGPATGNIQQTIARGIYHVALANAPVFAPAPVAAGSTNDEAVAAGMNTTSASGAPVAPIAPPAARPSSCVRTAPTRWCRCPALNGAKVGRNDPCPCGSGKKYKRCHGAAA